MTNTKNASIEALERAFPLHVLRQRLRGRSCAAGWSRGGAGIERDRHVLTDAPVGLSAERRVSKPWGPADGEPGAVGENWLLPNGQPGYNIGCMSGGGVDVLSTREIGNVDSTYDPYQLLGA